MAPGGICWEVSRKEADLDPVIAGIQLLTMVQSVPLMPETIAGIWHVFIYYLNTGIFEDT